MEWIAGQEKILLWASRVWRFGAEWEGKNETGEQNVEHGGDFAEVGAAITNLRITVQENASTMSLQMTSLLGRDRLRWPLQSAKSFQTYENLEIHAIVFRTTRGWMLAL